ncbi:aminotransferase class V-fold PLP-dependent enzyme [Ilumatobacter nonamiensis]|uniref:aminotransferase class V-fold PLP-dependent enzyme n=1 Tax=Ilumatobacter nonamiensis TaxID=467093 RepID=UPI00034775DF|nr:aminotransferase class V-fold PLP-dependent enzyme [Ilumatobacter nonamiensis]
MTTPFTDREVAENRGATPGCTDDLVHLNHAGSSLPPQVVLDAQIGHLRREATIGGYEAAAEAVDRSAAVYDSIATMIGASAKEIARTEHATAAWNAAFWSIPMAPGQRIITHDHDYGANWVAFLRAAEVHGVEIDRVPSDVHGQIDLERLATALEHPDEVALVSLAWIPTSGGLVNPAAQVGALANAAEVPFLLDACQAAGQVEIDVDELGCDFLSATGRKFLRGPRGTGFLYARESILDRVTPSHPDHHGADWVSMDRFEYADGARRFEYWEHDHAGWLGLGAAVDHALELDIARVHATIDERAEQLRRGLDDAGMTVQDTGVERCGIVTSTHRSLSPAEVADRLTKASINVSTTMLGSARADLEPRGLTSMVRMSVHCTTTSDEIDRTLDVLRSL